MSEHWSHSASGVFVTVLELAEKMLCEFPAWTAVRAVIEAERITRHAQAAVLEADVLADLDRLPTVTA